MAAVYFIDYKEKRFEILSDRFIIVKSLRQSFHNESKNFQYLSHIRSNPRHLLRLKKIKEESRDQSRYVIPLAAMTIMVFFTDAAFFDNEKIISFGYSDRHSQPLSF